MYVSLCVGGTQSVDMVFDDVFLTWITSSKDCLNHSSRIRDSAVCTNTPCSQFFMNNIWMNLLRSTRYSTLASPQASSQASPRGGAETDFDAHPPLAYRAHLEPF
jgi:hypothetical protein